MLPNDERWRRELELLRDLRDGEMTLPDDLVRAFASARARTTAAWEDARDAGKYALLAPALGELVSLAREQAASIDATADPYDVLLDEYEPGLTRARLDPVFDGLRARLVPLVQDLTERTASWPTMPSRACPREKVHALCRFVLEAIGFDFTRGHLGEATHPGTTALGFGDVRLALRPVHDEIAEAILTALHEGGHGLYDQGFAEPDRATLLAQAPSMGMHEGQARLWENHVGRSHVFWRFLYPRMRSVLGPAVQGLDPEKFHHATSRVRATPIRATADELSYHLHILLRYELEVALISGNLRAADLAAAWNDRSSDLLGFRPENDASGVLQDGHWAAGMFGYFPTYTIGSLYAAQLFETFARERRVDAEIERGEFAPLKSWLNEKIHRAGDRLPAEKLLASVTGSGLDTGAYFRHIAAKFG